MGMGHLLVQVWMCAHIPIMQAVCNFFLLEDLKESNLSGGMFNAQ
jgi:hypothetical protein